MAVSGNLSYGSVTLVVQPENLTTQASDVSNKISTLKGLFDSMKTNVNKTAGYWIGDGGDAHRRLYQEQQSKIEEIISTLSERVSELNQMATNYTSNEQTATGEAAQLPTDVIS